MRSLEMIKEQRDNRELGYRSKALQSYPPRIIGPEQTQQSECKKRQR